ncbi:hypothetical protein EP331_09725 [bacterium]|nr:MAG: hypothetical protein EP331_09725 [bacterium]
MSLSTDLFHIRTLQGLSIEDVYQITKMPVDIIKSIENGEIFNDSSKNVTYQRSFIRSYSKALKIAENHMIEALDQFYNDTYSNLLLNEYGDPSKVEKSEKKERKRIPSEDENVETNPNPTPIAVQKTEPSIPPIEKPVEAKESKTATPTKKIETAANQKAAYPDLPPQPTQSAYNKTQAPPSIQSVNWADVGKKSISMGSMPAIAIAVVLLILIIAAGTWYIIDTVDFENLMASTENKKETVVKPSTPTIDEQQNATVDTMQTVATPIVKPEPIIPTLSDTLAIVIFAEKDKLEPVKVKTDLSGSYFPYWVEQGQAMRFEFIDTVSIRGQYNRMAVLFNGHLVEEFKNFRGPNREIILTRSIFASDPKWAAALDSTDIKTKPDTVLDRPVFN